MKAMNGVAAEHAHAVDAAARPRDRSFFEGQKRLGRDSDLSMAAQLMGRPLGGKGTLSSSTNLQPKSLSTHTLFSRNILSKIHP